MATTSGMRGEGYYDAHSEYQRRTAQASGALVDQAVASMPLPPPGEAFVVVDYGSSTGRNSIGQVRRALEALRARGADHRAVVVHDDVPTNDFNTLFANLYGDRPDSYLGLGDVVPMAAAASFYDAVAAPGTVSLGVSFAAAHWLREPPPVDMPDSLYVSDAPDDQRALLEAAAAADWTRFLAHRADELRPGGRLVVGMVGAAPEPGDPSRLRYTADALLRLMNEVALELVVAGRLDAGAYRRFAFPVVPRSAAQASAPFAGELAGRLDLLSCDVGAVPSPYYEAYREHRDPRRYAEEYVAFVRAFTESALRDGLMAPGASGGEAPDALLDAFFARMTERVAADPDAHVFEDWNLTVVAARPA